MSLVTRAPTDVVVCARCGPPSPFDEDPGLAAELDEIVARADEAAEGKGGDLDLAALDDELDVRRYGEEIRREHRRRPAGEAAPAEGDALPGRDRALRRVRRQPEGREAHAQPAGVPAARAVLPDRREPARRGLPLAAEGRLPARVPRPGRGRGGGEGGRGGEGACPPVLGARAAARLPRPEG